MQKIVSFLRFFILSFLIISCSSEINTELKQGMWKGELQMQEQSLPFLFEIVQEDENFNITLLNSSEELEMDNVTIKDDSLFFTLGIFDIDIKAKILENRLEGLLIKNYFDDYKLPFSAVYNTTSRFENPKSSASFNGRWAMTFFDGEKETGIGIGIFKKNNDHLNGTILTPTGDYRYLEGISSENEMKLFTFDGNHAFIFTAELENDSIMKGHFYSGKSFHESFKALKNDTAELPNADSLTYLKEGYDNIAFSFPNLEGKMTQLSDPKYKDKIVIVQLFGTWCPNCMDESIFYADWYKKNKHRGVEIIGLAYEAKSDFDYASSRVKNMKEKLGIEYDFLIAGTFDKKEAAKTLPMLNHVMSFPTSIIIDKTGQIRKIHTGFSGPATGDYYSEYVESFNLFIDKLLNEE